MVEQASISNPPLLCLGKPEQKVEYKSTPTIGEISHIKDFTDIKRRRYSTITKVYKWISAAAFSIGAYVGTSKMNNSEMNLIEDLGSLAVTSLGFVGYYYSAVRNTALSYFKGE